MKISELTIKLKADIDKFERDITTNFSENPPKSTVSLGELKRIEGRSFVGVEIAKHFRIPSRFLP